ncbi:MAG: 2-phosphosulfolactate phosphatase [Chloroflexota bacterium]
MYFDQSEYKVRFEWGLAGIEALAPVTDVFIIVDVLSFTTSVDIVIGNGGIVYPYNGPGDELEAFAKERDALFAKPGRKQVEGYSLSPSSLVTMPEGTRFVLPSPNGSRLSLATGDVPTLAGCLRNPAWLTARANQMGERISVIAAGERWKDGSLRPSLEDLIGAGAMIFHLEGGELSPEAKMAMAAFENALGRLPETLSQCGSGKELIARGFEEDVRLASKFNASVVAPELRNGAYIQIGVVRGRDEQ